jgi:hypothetical protein
VVSGISHQPDGCDDERSRVMVNFLYEHMMMQDLKYFGVCTARNHDQLALFGRAM